MVRMLKRVSNTKVTRMRKTTKQTAKSARNDGAATLVTKNKAAVALGKLGGRKGGLRRAKNLTAAQRTAIATKAAKARWKIAKAKKVKHSAV